MWITAESFTSKILPGLADLSSEQGEQAKLQKTLFVLDDYDDNSYRLSTKDGQSSWIQHELNKLGVSRQVHMSATVNQEELRNRTERKEFKVKRAEREVERGGVPTTATRVSGWRESMARLIDRAKMAAQTQKQEFRRDTNFALANGDAKSRFANIVKQQLSEYRPEVGRANHYLIEMPDARIGNRGDSSKTISELDIARTASRLSSQLDGGPVGIGYLTEGGKVMMAVSEDGVPASIQGFSDFKKASEGKGYTVCCLYTRDSVGGDFERFSLEDVRAQAIVYDEHRSSNSVYQHMRRRRPNPNEKTPVTFFLKPEGFKEFSVGSISETIVPLSVGMATFLERSNAIYKKNACADEGKRLKGKCLKKGFLYRNRTAQQQFSEIMNSPSGARLKRLYPDAAKEIETIFSRLCTGRAVSVNEDLVASGNALLSALNEIFISQFEKHCPQVIEVAPVSPSRSSAIVAFEARVKGKVGADAADGKAAAVASHILKWLRTTDNGAITEGVWNELDRGYGGVKDYNYQDGKFGQQNLTKAIERYAETQSTDPSVQAELSDLIREGFGVGSDSAYVRSLGVKEYGQARPYAFNLRTVCALSGLRGAARQYFQEVDLYAAKKKEYERAEKEKAQVRQAVKQTFSGPPGCSLSQLESENMQFYRLLCDEIAQEEQKATQVLDEIRTG